MGGLRVRAARVEDAEAVARLSDELRAHLGDPLGHLSAEVIRRDGFGKAREFDLIVAERDEKVIGYALFYDAYEPAYAAKGLYLADFCVSASARRSGVGRALIAAVTQAAKDRGRIYVWWVCKPDNEGALAFYRALTPEVIEPMISHALIFR
jgi:ribosomal protein S18 acetylase RimI-like enzyme